MTVSDAEIESGDGFRLLDSMLTEDVRAVIVVRGERFEDMCHHEAAIAVISTSPCGVSVARNIGLAWLASRNLNPDAVILFPDDDGHFPAGYVQSVRELCMENDLVLGSYDETGSASMLDVVRLTPWRVYRAGNSVGIAIRWSLLTEIGRFDDLLGVGSGVVEAGEDLDLLLRGTRAATSPVFAPRLRFVHPRSTGVPPERLGAHLSVAVLHLPAASALIVLLRGLVAALTRRNGMSFRIWFRTIRTGAHLRVRRATRLGGSGR